MSYEKSHLYNNLFFHLGRFHGLGLDGQKGVKDLLRMESDDEGSDSELLDIENPSTPGGTGDIEENSSFHSGVGGGAADSSPKDLKHINNNNTTDDRGVSPPPPSQEDRKPPVLDFSFLNGGGSLHNKSEDGAIRNWLKGTEGTHLPPPAPPPLASLPGPIPGFPAGAHTGLPHPHPLHPFLLPFSAFAAAAAAAAASAPPPTTASSVHHTLFPPAAAAAAAASHHLASHSSPFHVKDSV